MSNSMELDSGELVRINRNKFYYMIPKKGYVVPRARQVDMVPQIWNGYSETSSATLKHYPKKLNNIHYFFENRGSTIVYIEKEINECEGEILKQYLKGKTFLKGILRKHSELGRKAEHFAWKVLSNLEKIKGGDVVTTLEQIQKAWIDFDQANVSAWFLGGESLQKYLREKLQDKYGLSQSDTETLFASSQLSLPTLEELTTLKLAVRFYKKPVESLVLEKLEKDFGWIPYGYDGPVFWNREHFKKKLVGLKKVPLGVLKDRILSIEKGLKGTVLQQKNILRKFGIGKQEKRLLEQLQILISITDERKKFQFQLHYAFHEVLKKLVSQTGMSLLELKYLDVSEIRDMLLTQKFASWKKQARERIGKLMYLHIANGKIGQLVVGSAVKNIRKKYLEEIGLINEIKGQIGNRTKSPVVTGRVRVIMTSREIGKMKKGEILVTWMTSPDFVPAMRKAKAVVTDEGGITCHAAIVSRELGIPAIIGTQIATKVLKDGDLVEVDANNGTVRKIDRS